MESAFGFPCKKTLPSFGAGLNSLRDLSQIYVTSASLYLYFKTPEKIQEASMILSTVMERGTKAVLLFYCLASVWFSVDSVTMPQSLRALLEHFTKTRNVEVDHSAKQKVRDFIVKTFSDHGLHTWTEEFPSNNAQYPGVNIIGQLPGRFTGTRADKIFLIGAHYDTVKTTPGVDDNGSGMTALLQALQLFTSPDKLNCSQDYTLLFVAFDMEETQPACPLQGKCSCSGGLCGSGHFVQNFSTLLNSSGVGFQGALILETILNHNTTPNSQDIPQSLQKVLPAVHDKVAKNNFTGDFLAVIGRLANDEGLIKGITNAFKQDATFKTLEVELPYPLEGRPSNWPQIIIQSGVRHFFRSDHYNFWNANHSLPAVFITDTAEFRGYMRQCYHQSCDDISHVTSNMITFLARTTDSIVKVATNMTNEECQMKKVVDCGQDVTADEGEITTPYYDTQYPNKLDCAWIISVDAEQKDLSLKFTTFDLEESADCTADYVEIRNGKDQAAPIIGKYCGKTPPELIKASTQSLYIVFHSDELGAFKGFKAEWSSTPVTRAVSKNAVKGYCQGMWQLIGFPVMTSLAFVL